MAFPFVPSKRSYERMGGVESGRRGKLQKTGPSSVQKNQFKVTPGSMVFRILCPASKSGGVIGKGGSIIKRIRQETGAKIRLEGNIAGCDERIVVITVPEKEVDVNDGKQKDDGDGGGGDDGTADDGDKGEKEGTDNDEETQNSSAGESLKSEKAKSSSLKALLLIFERIVEDDAEVDEDDAAEKASTVSARLLVVSSQVGCLLGKGGSVIKQMSADSGAQIRILPKDKLPLCASPVDEIVQITGGIESVKKALQSVSQQLLENPPRDRDTFPPINPTGPSSHPFASMPRPEGLRPASFQMPHEPPFPRRPFDVADYHPRFVPPFPQFNEGIPLGQPPITPELLSYQLMCSNEKVGSVIGKGGSIVKNLKEETGCDIKILETTPESEDRVIIISGCVLPDERIDPVQDAVLRVQHRILIAAPDNKEHIGLARIIVPSNQIGCLLGKGGAIITEMRKFTGAQIRIMAKEQLPKGLHEDDEVVQISGEFASVQEALLQITGRLKHNHFRDRLSAMNPHSHPSFVEQLPPYGSFMGRRESPPPNMFSNFVPFQKDSMGRPYDERTAFGSMMHGPGGPHSFERNNPWASQAMREAGGSNPLADYPAGPVQRRTGVFPGPPAIITHTTVDVVVPQSVIPSIRGEDGGCLRRIIEISEAKITITEPRPEAKETMIIIFGTPEQTHAAQSLIQAFVLSESGVPLSAAS